MGERAATVTIMRDWAPQKKKSSRAQTPNQSDTTVTLSRTRSICLICFHTIVRLYNVIKTKMVMFYVYTINNRKLQDIPKVC